MIGRQVYLGEIVGVFGVKGWVKVRSGTEPKENILTYSPWYLDGKGESRSCRVLEGTIHGKIVVVRIEGVDTRDQAAKLCGLRISVDRERLPPPEKGEYYWADLVGLKVVTVDGVALGTVDSLFETGANDVVVVKGEREHLIPFLQDRYIRQIDLAAGTMTVDWDPEY